MLPIATVSVGTAQGTLFRDAPAFSVFADVPSHEPACAAV